MIPRGAKGIRDGSRERLGAGLYASRGGAVGRCRQREMPRSGMKGDENVVMRCLRDREEVHAWW